MKNKFLKTIFVAFIAVLTFSCDNKDDNTEVIVPKKSILDIAKADPNFSILVAAIKKAGLDAPGASPLSSAGSFTVFAPTNAAFAASLPTYTEAYINGLTAATDASTIAGLKQILLNHILSGAVKSGDITDKSYVRTFAQYNNSSTTLSMFIRSNAGVILNGGDTNGGAKVVSADIVANNGVIHVLDRVLALPTIVSQLKANPDQFSTLVNVVSSVAGGAFGDQTAVLGVLNGALPGSATALTVYAPTNSAFTTATATGGFLTDPLLFGSPALLDVNIAKVLKYHVQTNNFPAATTTSFSSATATADQTVTTLSTQKFKLIKLTLNITEDLLQTTVLPTDSKATLLNIQASNGVVFGISRVLKPTL